MKVYGVQFDMQWEDKKANFRTVREMLAQANVEPGSLIVLPEMFATGFSMNAGAIAHGEPYKTESFLTEMALQTKTFVLGGLTALSSGGKGRNMLLVCNPQGSTIAHYQKMHPFSYAGETQHYICGDQLTLFDCREYTIAPFICYDLRFPEIFRHAVQLGANLFVVIACWPAAREAHWLALLQARAIENQAYVIGVNRCGADPKLAYSGRSIVYDPLGKVVVDAGSEPEVVCAELDVSVLENFRRDFPALADIRREYRHEEVE
ncbi:carbon-nitrogen family hydrolase [bacterium]|nr:carbon-nitrogen family hydrolase [bacterium]